MGSKKEKCGFCDGTYHKTDDCPFYTPKKEPVTLYRCLKCRETDHVASECTANMKKEYWYCLHCEEYALHKSTECRKRERPSNQVRR